MSKFVPSRGTLSFQIIFFLRPDRDMCLRRKKSSDRYMRARYRTTTKRPTEYDYEHENENPGDYPTDDDYIDETNPHTLGRDGLVDVASNAISQCPVENGVVRTIGGSVSVGPLLAGIAAGLKQQNVRFAVDTPHIH